MITSFLRSQSVIYTHRSGRRIKERVARMLEKKAQLGEDFKYSLKCPKGTRDYAPKAMAIRENVIKLVSDCFKRHGAETIDTPVFELKETLIGKYGEDGGKLIYDMADQGGELLSMRYDLTVPFARYLAMNKISNIKRYQIAKVYRRDQPALTRGRYREFYQCDFDIAGQYDPLIPEAECLRIADEILTDLGLGQFEIKINHRLLLEGMFTVCGVSEANFKTVSSSIDKLDKVEWAAIRKELIEEKAIEDKTVDALGKYIRIREINPNLSNDDLIDLLESDYALIQNENSKKSLTELRLLLSYCDHFGILSRVVVEPSLARGLDYYTGCIFEVIINDYSRCASDENRVTVGSVAAGGRYDKLVGMLSSKDRNVPCAGISFGIERLFSIMEMKAQSNDTKIRTVETEVFVASAQKGLLQERMKICRMLWDVRIKAEMSYKANPKMLSQLQYCEEHQIPLAVVVGERELKEGIAKIRQIETREELDVPKDDLIAEIRHKLLNSQINHAKSDLA